MLALLNYDHELRSSLRLIRNYIEMADAGYPPFHKERPKMFPHLPVRAVTGDLAGIQRPSHWRGGWYYALATPVTRPKHTECTHHFRSLIPALGSRQNDNSSTHTTESLSRILSTGESHFMPYLLLRIYVSKITARFLLATRHY
jgi:hypothetical protein